MNNLFNQSGVSEIITRIEKLSPNAQRQWGKMNVAQMLAHCHIAVETARGTHVCKRIFIGRLIGGLVKNAAINEKPFSKNSPTDKTYIFPSDLNFEEQKDKLVNSITKFKEGGPSQCTTHPHPFFGNFTPQEWAILQWKHLDHHLRQFGV